MFEAIVTLPFLSCAIVCVYWYVFISCINSLCKLCHIFPIVAFFCSFLLYSRYALSFLYSC